MQALISSRTSREVARRMLSGVNYSVPSTTTRFPDSCLNFFLSFSRVSLLLAGT
jgi:hypothetical protein